MPSPFLEGLFDRQRASAVAFAAVELDDGVACQAAFRAVQYPRGACAVAGLHDRGQPVDEVADNPLVATQCVGEDFVDRGRHCLWGFASVEHDGRRLEFVDHPVLGVNADHVVWIEDQVPFWDKVSDGHTVLLGEVTQLRFILGRVDVENVSSGLVRAPPVDACPSVAESEIQQAG